jgi:predicted glycosyltransferase
MNGSPVKKILFTVLNWGLGHASRSVPLIHTLKARGHRVYIASDGDALNFLTGEFPDLHFLELPSYGISYRYSTMLGNIARATILKTKTREKRYVDKWHRKINFDLIISDNRYGCYHPQVKSILVTHQVQIETGNRFLNNLSRKLINRWLLPFDRIWIPDREDEPRFAGTLSCFSDERKTDWIGILSTMKPQQMEVKWDALIVLSGPEPRRSQFEKTIVREAAKISGYRFLIVQGKPRLSEEKRKKFNHIEVISHLQRNELNSIINMSDLVIARSGYSTLMDLFSLGKKAVLVPTPGQPEQEYLARYHTNSKQFLFVDEKEFMLSKALEESIHLCACPPVPVDQYLPYLLKEIEK